MLTNFFRPKFADDGFTLIEMLVVVTILGILMGIAVLGFSGFNRLAIIKSCKVDYQSVQSALNSLKNDYDIATVGSQPLTNSSLYSNDSGTLANLGYMSRLNDNRTKYLIEISGSISSLPQVTSTGDPSIATACTS
jgi:prepilin-type N-terminal cleavage/methylation domain-containing protein